MNYEQALNQVIDDGIEAARADYTKEEDKLRLQGSIAGFKACKMLMPDELRKLLTSSRENTYKHLEDGMHWYYTCYYLEVEWVCNVISAILMTNNYPTIINPTARGVMKAADRIGVAEA